MSLYNILVVLLAAIIIAWLSHTKYVVAQEPNSVHCAVTLGMLCLLATVLFVAFCIYSRAFGTLVLSFCRVTRVRRFFSVRTWSRADAAGLIECLGAALKKLGIDN